MKRLGSSARPVICLLGGLLGLLVGLIHNAVADEWQLLGPGDADQVTAITVSPSGAVWVGTDVGGLYYSSDKGERWRSRNQGLRNLDVTTGVVFSTSRPHKLLVGTRGGLYTSDDGGKNWRNIRQGLSPESAYGLSGSVGALAVDPFNPDSMVMGYGYRPSYEGNTTISRIDWSRQLYLSDDAGESWQGTTVFDRPTRVNHLVYSPVLKQHLYAATEEGLFLSDDGGRTWQLLRAGAAINLHLSTVDAEDMLLAVGEGGVLRSRDGGLSWSDATQGLRMRVYGVVHSNRYCCLSGSPEGPGVVYVANSSWGYGGGLYRSDNFGESWQLLSEDMPESWLDTSSRFNAVATPAKEGSQTLYSGTSRYLYRSDDGGQHWRQLISRPTGGGWRNTGINVFGQTRFLFPDLKNPNAMFIGTADHKMLKSKDGGLGWRLLERSNKQASNIWDMAMCPDAGGALYAVSSGNDRRLCFMSSVDKGENWSTSCGAIGKSDRYERLLLDPDNCNRLYLGTAQGLYSSDSSGMLWHKDRKFPGTKIYDMSFGETPDEIYVAAREGLLHSDDRGESWRVLKKFGKHRVTAVLVSRADPQRLLVGTWRFKNSAAGLYLSEDRGRNWQEVQGGISQYVTGFVQLPANPSVIYASTMDHNSHDDSKGSGVFVSLDSGASWASANEGLPVLRGYRLSSSALHPDKVFFASAGSGVFVRTHSGAQERVTE